MDKYKKYYGLIVFLVLLVLLLVLAGIAVNKLYSSYTETNDEYEKVSNELRIKLQEQNKVREKLAKLKESMISAQKKVYFPVEDKIDNDTLFFTLYSDLIEMVHSNTVKIKSIDYTYKPQGDPFVAQEGKYFVCDVNMQLVSNYVNLGKLVQDIYQYPYYIRIMDLEVKPYPKDKKILLTSLRVRLYAHTSPEDAVSEEIEAGLKEASVQE